MKNPLPIWLQLTFLVLLLGAAAALWFGQDQVSDVFAGINGREPPPKIARARDKRMVPVVVAPVGRRSNDTVIEAIATARAKRSVTLYPEVSGQIVDFQVSGGDRVGRGNVILQLDSRDAELALELAKVRVAEAERQLARAEQLMQRNVSSGAKVEDARTVLQRTRLEVKQAEEALSKRTIRAPFDGIVGIPKVETGDRVSTTTEIITVDDRSELIVEIEVPEQFLSQIEPEQKVGALTPSFPGRPFEGTVDRIDSRIDPVSRAVMVRAGVPNPRDLLRPGMSFAVTLNIPGKSYPAVPELALQWRKGESYVWRIGNGKAERVPVLII